MLGLSRHITTAVRLLMIVIAAMWLPMNCCCLGMSAAKASDAHATEGPVTEPVVSVEPAQASCCSGGSHEAASIASTTSSGDETSHVGSASHHHNSTGSQPCGKQCSGARVSRTMPSSPTQVPSASAVVTLLPITVWMQVLAPAASFRVQTFVACDVSPGRTLLAQHCALTT